MPTYEYECQKCGHRFEQFQSITADPLKRCPKPKCRGKVKRLLGTGAGIIFKGSGFYLTDYGRGTGSKSESANTKAGKADSGATSSGGDSAAKSDSGSADTKSSASETSSAKPAASKSE
jgi:putative FmdB family regulatory protein